MVQTRLLLQFLSLVMYRALQWSELRLHIKRVSYFQFVVCLQIHPLTGDIVNSKLFLMDSASHRALFKLLVYYCRFSYEDHGCHVGVLLTKEFCLFLLFGTSTWQHGRFIYCLLCLSGLCKKLEYRQHLGVFVNKPLTSSN